MRKHLSPSKRGFLRIEKIDLRSPKGHCKDSIGDVEENLSEKIRCFHLNQCFNSRFNQSYHIKVECTNYSN